MKFGKYAHSHPIVKLAVWCGILVAFFVVFMIIVALLANAGVNMGYLTSIRWTLVAQDLAFFILPALLVACLWSGNPAQWLHLRSVERGRTWWIYVLAVLIPIACLPFNNTLVHVNEQMNLPQWLKPLEEWMRQMEDAADLLTQQLIGVESVGGFVANLIVVALLAGLGEELCFRGVLQNIVSERSSRSETPHAAIWVTAIVFSAIHFQFYGFVPRLLLGALFGYALCWTGSLWVPIVMHCTNNGFVVIAVFIGKKLGWDIESLDAIGTGETMWIGVVSMAVTMILIYLLRRSTTMSKASSRTSIGS